VTLVDVHEVGIFAQSNENDRAGDRDEQDALERVGFLGLHLDPEFQGEMGVVSRQWG